MILLSRLSITFEKKVIHLYKILQDRIYIPTKLYQLKEHKLVILIGYIFYSFYL